MLKNVILITIIRTGFIFSYIWHMRIISILLISYISLLIISPSVGGMFVVAEETNMCCNSDDDNQCSREQSENRSSDKDSPCTPCCLIQNCNCCFLASSSFEFQPLIAAGLQKIQSKNDQIHSNYLSDCWHPPEMS